MSKLSRQKGAAWEREVAKLFNEAMPGADAKRGLSQARNGGEVADVDIPWFWVEAKHRRALTAQAALKQALEACRGKGKMPVAVLKLHRQEPFVALFLEDFLSLVKLLWTLAYQKRVPVITILDGSGETGGPGACLQDLSPDRDLQGDA